MFNTEYFDDKPARQYTPAEMRFLQSLDEASAQVASWPEWKRLMVEDSLSMSPTAKTPRPYVNNNPDNDCF